MPAVHLRIVGRVQGVGFRWYVREQARRGGMTGWVRNNADGSVEIAAAGEPESVSRFLAAVKRGPPGSAVERIDALEPQVEEPLPDPFVVIR